MSAGLPGVQAGPSSEVTAAPMRTSHFSRPAGRRFGRGDTPGDPETVHQGRPAPTGGPPRAGQAPEGAAAKRQDRREGVRTTRQDRETAAQGNRHDR
ncbi:hypothetical protein Sros01_35830 [Streptomyces roseochromogenus]|nr:hypothetical protein Sros01_35830 [Streptomyces roseochromogenus]